MKRVNLSKLPGSAVVWGLVFLSCACSRTPYSLIQDIKKGGYVIYFRHAETERDYADQADPKMKLNDCKTQRKLSKKGIKQSRDIGASFRRNKIPVGNVIASDYCRSWKTAQLAFGRYTKNSKLNFLPFEKYTPDQIETMKVNLKPFLSSFPEKGKNTVVVGHDDLFEAATGIYPKPQGIAYIVSPKGKGSYQIVGKILPREWNDF